MVIIPDYIEKHYEIIDGRKKLLSRQNVEHGLIKTNLTFIFVGHCRKINRGKALVGLYVYLPDNKNVFIPDFSVFLDKSLFKPNQKVYGVPDLVVEILSPSTLNNDFGIKKDTYEKNGVKEYWIVNSVDKSIQVYHLIDGKFNLDDVYHVYSDQELSMLEDDERDTINYKIKVSILDDLIVDVNDVFYNIPLVT